MIVVGVGVVWSPGAPRQGLHGIGQWRRGVLFLALARHRPRRLRVSCGRPKLPLPESPLAFCTAEGWTPLYEEPRGPPAHPTWVPYRLPRAGQHGTRAGAGASRPEWVGGLLGIVGSAEIRPIGGRPERVKCLWDAGGMGIGELGGGNGGEGVLDNHRRIGPGVPNLLLLGNWPRGRGGGENEERSRV